MAKYPKKPKQPKRSASVNTWENYHVRFQEWKKKCAAIDSAKKRKEQLINAAKSHSHVSGAHVGSVKRRRKHSSKKKSSRRRRK